MNKIVLSIVIAFCTLSTSAQKGIRFFEGNWEKAKIKAQKENKLLFVDFYTQWCGPCLNMAKNVFVVSEVGQFYNENFVCLKIDAETKNGETLAKQYAVQSYPTYVFVNPENEKLIHRSGGRKSVEEFLLVGEAALHPQKTSEYILSQYAKGNRNLHFMVDYVRYMSSIYKRDAVKTVFNEIIKNGGKLTDQPIWELYRDCIHGYQNPYLMEVSNHYENFVNLFGKQEVDEKLAAETQYCNEEMMNRLCQFEGKEFNMRLKGISDEIHLNKNYHEAGKLIDALLVDESVNKQEVIDRLKFMIRLNKHYGENYPKEWFYKSIQYLRYIAYNDENRDDARVHYNYAVALEMLFEKIVNHDFEIPKFLTEKPESGKQEYSNRPLNLKQKPKRKK